MKIKERMWVHPDFKKKIKLESVKMNKTILDFTKELSGSDNLEDYFKNGNKKFRI